MPYGDISLANCSSRTLMRRKESLKMSLNLRALVLMLSRYAVVLMNTLARHKIKVDL